MSAPFLLRGRACRRLRPTDRWFGSESGLAEALRNELQLYGISVHLFLPATIHSPGFENEQRLKPEVTKRIEGPDEGMSPDDVAREMLRGASSPLDSPGFPGSRDLQTEPRTASIAGLEREDFYITYEPVGHMLRNSRAITPRNNLLFDAFWSLAGIVSLAGADSSSPSLLFGRSEKADRLATADRLSYLEDRLARRRGSQGRQGQCEGIGKGDPTEPTVRAGAVPTTMSSLLVQFLFWGVPWGNGIRAVLIQLAR